MPELAVLVPVLNRPQNVAPLVESFWENCPKEQSTLWLILGAHPDVTESPRHDEYYAAFTPYESIWTHLVVAEDYGNEIGDPITQLVTWPEKINWGVEHIEADWYLCAADDITFIPGWWEATTEARSRVGFIGTNDSVDGTGNPRVRDGIHTCHPLVSAEYVARGGADGGPFCYEGVKHWYIDDILIETAKQRGQWEYIPEAVIQHNHPYWGRGEWDATYTQGEANAETDRAAFIDFATKYLGLTVG